MSVLSTLENLKTDAINLYKEVSAKVTILKQVWVEFDSTQNRALALKLYADAVKAVADVTAASAAQGLNLALDAQTVADLKAVIADAKAGVPSIVADLKLLGITIK